MKSRFNLFAILALLFMVSCSSDNDNPSTTLAESIQGTYKGYTVAEFKYTEIPMITPDESVVLTVDADGTSSISFASSKWGTFSMVDVQVSVKEDIYSIKGQGKTVMGMSEESKKEYECELEGTMSKDKKTVNFVFTVPSVMGGLKVTFNLGDAPAGDVIAGTYKGELTLSVGEMSLDPVKDSQVKINSQANGKAELTLAGFSGMGTMKMEDITITDVEVKSSENNSYTLSGAINAKSGTINVIGKLEGSIIKDEANITFTMKPGAMPMDITAVFKGKK